MVLSAAWRKNSNDAPPRFTATTSSLDGQPDRPHSYGQCNHPAHHLEYPASPQCHLHGGAPNGSTCFNTSDPVLLQQFIQTQQMLINSVSQCNQLLWEQQRDINNLNSAVILVILWKLINFNGKTMIVCLFFFLCKNLLCVTTASGAYSKFRQFPTSTNHHQQQQR